MSNFRPGQKMEGFGSAPPLQSEQKGAGAAWSSFADKAKSAQGGNTSVFDVASAAGKAFKTSYFQAFHPNGLKGMDKDFQRQKKEEDMRKLIMDIYDKHNPAKAKDIEQKLPTLTGDKLDEALDEARFMRDHTLKNQSDYEKMERGGYQAPIVNAALPATSSGYSGYSAPQSAQAPSNPSGPWGQTAKTQQDRPASSTVASAAPAAAPAADLLDVAPAAAEEVDLLGTGSVAPITSQNLLDDDTDDEATDNNHGAQATDLLGFGTVGASSTAGALDLFAEPAATTSGAGLLANTYTSAQPASSLAGNPVVDPFAPTPATGHTADLAAGTALLDPFDSSKPLEAKLAESDPGLFAGMDVTKAPPAAPPTDLILG